LIFDLLISCGGVGFRVQGLGSTHSLILIFDLLISCGGLGFGV